MRFLSFFAMWLLSFPVFSATSLMMPTIYQNARPLEKLFTDPDLHLMSLQQMRRDFLRDVRAGNSSLDLRYSYPIPPSHVINLPELAPLKQAFTITREANQLPKEEQRNVMRKLDKHLSELSLSVTDPKPQLFYREYTLFNIEDNTIIKREIDFTGEFCSEFEPQIGKQGSFSYAVYRQSDSSFAMDGTRCQHTLKLATMHHGEPYRQAIQKKTLKAYEILLWKGEMNSYSDPLLHSLVVVLFDENKFIAPLAIHQASIPSSTWKRLIN